MHKPALGKNPPSPRLIGASGGKVKLEACLPKLQQRQGFDSDFEVPIHRDEEVTLTIMLLDQMLISESKTRP
jgi:hypothetical protein